MQSIFQLVMLIPTTISVVVVSILVLKYENKFSSITATLNDEEYKFCELFHVGFQALEIVHFDIKSEKSRKKVKEVAEIYGRKYAEYYYYTMLGAQVTYGILLVPIVLLLATLSNNPLALVYGIVIAVLLVWYMRELFQDKLTARREALLLEFPQVLFKMTLLVNAGMMLRDAWHDVAASSDGVIYQEMNITAQELKNGISEYEAYRNFADRCAIKEMRKFASLVTQGLSKGSGELSMFLKEMSDEMWEEKKNLVKQKGEKASSQLLLPTVMIFAGILIMIMAPMLGGI